MILTIDEMHFLYILVGGYYNECKEIKDEEGMKLAKNILAKLGIKNPDEVGNERKQK